MRTRGRPRFCLGQGPQPTTLRAIRKQARDCGSHFFDPGTMRFFDSRVSSVVFPGRDGESTFFVTSERFSFDTPRLWSVRRIKGCSIDTIGEFQQFSSRKDALRAAGRLAGS